MVPWYDDQSKHLRYQSRVLEVRFGLISFQAAHPEHALLAQRKMLHLLHAIHLSQQSECSMKLELLVDRWFMS